MGEQASGPSFLFSHLDSKKIVILLFCFSFIYSFFLLQGTPFFMHGEDDFYMAWTAMQASWSELFHAVFIERLSLNVDENFYGNIAERGAYFLFFKLVIVFDGMQHPDLNYLSRMLLFSLTGVFLYRLLEEFGVHKVFSVGGVLLYITAMPTYSVLKLIGDTTLYSHFFMLLCYYLFFTKYLKQDKTNPFFLSLFIFLSGLFAIKSKQIAMTLPIVVFSYCIFVKQNVQGVIKRRIPLFSLGLLYYLPFSFSTLTQSTAQKGIEHLNFLLNFRTYYIYNPWTNMPLGEQIPALFSPFQSYLSDAGSLIGIYKFFLGWFVLFFVICFILLLYKKFREHKKIEDGHILVFLFLWHVLEIAIMSLYFEQGMYLSIRYVCIALPSFILFTFFSLQKGFNYFTEKRYFKDKKHILYYIFIFFLFLTILSNIYSSAIHIRGAEISRHTLIHDSIIVIYKDYFQKTDVDDTIFFRVGPGMMPRAEEAELAQIFYTDLAAQFGTTYDPKDAVQIQEKVEQKGFVYIATFRYEIPFINKILLGKLSACPSETSVYCYLKEIVRGEARTFYVYKVFPTSM